MLETVPAQWVRENEQRIKRYSREHCLSHTEAAFTLYHYDKKYGTWS